jgi:hypothetical protein
VPRRSGKDWRSSAGPSAANVQIDFQWGLGDADWIRSAAAQLLRGAPDLILANGDAATRIVQQSTRTVPVIFIAGSDPVAEGLVQSLAHPAGNLTGFLVLEPSLGAKLLELLKEIAPSVGRIAIPLQPGQSRQSATCHLGDGRRLKACRRRGDGSPARTGRDRGGNDGVGARPDMRLGRAARSVHHLPPQTHCGAGSAPPAPHDPFLACRDC